MPPSIRRIVLELGLRYRPAAADRIAAHLSRLEALMADLAELPPAMLERATAQWVRDKPFLPRASELVRLTRDLASAEAGSGGAPGRRLDVAARRNAAIAGEPGARHDLRWIDDEHGLRLVSLDELERHRRRDALPNDPPPSSSEGV